MTTTRYFRTKFVEPSEISPAQATGVPHFVGTYRDAELVEYRAVNGAGQTTETVLFRRTKRALCARILDADGNLQTSYYDFDCESFCRNAKVLFDAQGNVLIPKPPPVALPPHAVVVPSVSIEPADEYEAQLAPFAGQMIQLYLPKKHRLFQIDADDLHRTMSRLDILPVLAHGPDVDVFSQDFLPVLAWIRYFGVKTVTIHPEKGNPATGAAALAAMEREIREIGVDISYENMDASDRWLKDAPAIAALDASFTSLTLDIAHLPPDEDLIALTEQVFERIHVVHLNNRSGGQKDLPYRRGRHPVAQFLGLLAEQGYRGYVVLEYAPGYEAEQSADTSFIQELFAASATGNGDSSQG